jgi:putative AlgH/UPF0301 family transcriptional regulator
VILPSSARAMANNNNALTRVVYRSLLRAAREMSRRPSSASDIYSRYALCALISRPPAVTGRYHYEFKDRKSVKTWIPSPRNDDATALFDVFMDEYLTDEKAMFLTPSAYLNGPASNLHSFIRDKFREELGGSEELERSRRRVQRRQYEDFRVLNEMSSILSSDDDSEGTSNIHAAAAAAAVPDDDNKETEEVRMNVAMTCLRQMNETIEIYRSFAPLDDDAITHAHDDTSSHPSSSASVAATSGGEALQGVHLLSAADAIQNGAYLISHPLLCDGSFERSVVLLLDVQRDSDVPSDDSKSAVVSPAVEAGTTYGLIINKPTTVPLSRAFARADTLPPPLLAAFGEVPVFYGGPMNLHLQMLHRCDPQIELDADIGGRAVSSTANANGNANAMSNYKSSSYSGSSTTNEEEESCSIYDGIENDDDDYDDRG